MIVKDTKADVTRHEIVSTTLILNPDERKVIIKALEHFHGTYRHESSNKMLQSILYEGDNQ